MKNTTSGNSLRAGKDNTNSIQLLKQLALNYSRKQHPDVPEYARFTRQYEDRTANGLTRCIIDWIRFHGYQAERINSTGRLIDKRKTFTDSVGNLRTIGNFEWIHSTGTKGTADISATIKGRSVKIEVKAGKDRQSIFQKQYQEAVETAGGLYFIARNLDQFVYWYNSEFEKCK